MFDLAYTLESYDLVPANEGVFKAIGRGERNVRANLHQYIVHISAAH